MQSHLFVLISNRKEDFGTLLRIKTSDDSVSNPFIGFRNEMLGAQFIEARSLARKIELRNAKDLTGERLTALRSGNILLFSNEDEVARYVKQGQLFDFKKFTYTYADSQKNISEID